MAENTLPLGSAQDTAKQPGHRSFFYSGSG
jgi:hypothetical protein